MDWHQRYIQQANWTRDLRDYIFHQAGLDKARRILEVGCGTGAILSQLNTPVAIHGVDIEPAHVMQARVNAPAASVVHADAFSLPYPTHSFEIVFCHFLLLWLPNPLLALQEMMRVTIAGGHIIAFAEPDYSSRIDKPKELAQIGQWQADALQEQGADPNIGGRLAELFYQAGIQIIETGAISQSTSEPPSSAEWELEWAVLKADLAGIVPDKTIQTIKELDAKAWQNGERKLHVPTHYAWGIVTGDNAV